MSKVIYSSNEPIIVLLAENDKNVSSGNFDIMNRKKSEYVFNA